MIFAPGPRLTNFRAGSCSLSRTNARQQFLVSLELTGSESTQFGTDAATNTQQNSTRAFQALQNQHAAGVRVSLGRQSQQQLQRDQRTFGLAVHQLHGPALQLELGQHSLVLAEQAFVAPAPTIEL